MSVLDKLIACVGNWQGTNQLQDPFTGGPADSAATATVTPVIGGKFVRFDYTWAYGGEGQEGSYLIGYDSDANTATAYFMDSWHMGEKAMLCQGTVEPDGSVSVKGSYAAPEGPDWGWLSVITPGEDTLSLVMYNIEPDSEPELAVEAKYTRG